MSCCELIVGNTTEVWLKGYHRETAGTPIVDASPIATVLDANGNAVEGGESIELEYVADSEGDYLGTLPATAPIVAGARYTIRVVDEVNGFDRKKKVVAKDGSEC